MRRLVLNAVLAAFVSVLYILWWHPLPIVGEAVDWTVILIVAITLSEGPWYGSLTAVVVGLTRTWFSALPGVAYLIGSLAVVGVAWLVSRRIFTSRSTVSLLTTTAVATAAGFVFVMAADQLATIIDRERLSLPWASTLLATSFQVVIHPILLGLLWRVLGRSRYERLTMTMHRSF